MKILMTADTVGGVWTYAIDLARALRETQFVIATMGARASDAQRAEVPPNARLAESEFELEWMDDPWEDVARAGEWLVELEAREAPDVVHLNGYAHASLPFRAPKLVVAHSCVLSWWRAVKGEDAPAEWSRYHRAVELGLRAADLVVAPSAWMLGELHEHYRFDAPSRLIYNGTGVPRFLGSSGSSGGSSPRNRGTEEPEERKRSIVFSAGRMWDEAKNLRAVSEAVPLIAWPVRVAGDGSPLGRLDRAAMRRELAQASIYLFPAVYEPFGLSILEAAASGCALVIGDIPSLREIWRDAALFVPPRDPESIARSVNELIDNRDFRVELARRAMKRAGDFTPQRMAERYRDAYAALAAQEVRA